MEDNRIPKDTLAEVLIYLAENNTLESLSHFPDLKEAQVRFAIKELAQQVKREVQKEASERMVDFKKIKGLDKRTREILSTLSPRESKMLLRAFAINA